MKEKILSITIDGGSVLKKGAELANFPRIYCFYHLFNLAIHNFLEFEYICPIFKKCRKIMKFFSKSNSTLPEVEEELFQPEKFKFERPKSILKYSKTRWLRKNGRKKILYNLNSIQTLLKEKKEEIGVETYEIIINYNINIKIMIYSSTSFKIFRLNESISWIYGKIKQVLQIFSQYGSEHILF